MADEILYSGLGDLTTAEILGREIALLLADRASLRNSPFLVLVGDPTGTGSTTTKQPYAGLDGYDEMASVAEGASVANTALSDNSQLVSVARQAIQYTESDLANMILPDGSVDVERLALSIVGSAEMRFTSMVAGVIDDFTQTAGTTGTDLTVAKFQTAMYQIERAPAPSAEMVAVLAPIQITDLQTDLTTLTGAIQWMPATADAIMAKGQGFQFNLLGVDVHKSSKVITSGGDRKGGMWHRGAVLYSEGTPKPIRGGFAIYPAGTKIMVEFGRNQDAALTKVTGNYYAGTARAVPVDTLGVTIISSAT